MGAVDVTDSLIFSFSFSNMGSSIFSFLCQFVMCGRHARPSMRPALVFGAREVPGLDALSKGAAESGPLQCGRWLK